jgi:uncharacterized membrane protein YkvA (DUF1232 family)
MSKTPLDYEFAQLPTVLLANERIVRERFFYKLRRWAGHVPFAEDLVAAYCCAIDARTPTRVRAVLMAAIAYFVLPVDMIPDVVAGFGFTDDATVIATAIGLVSGHVKSRHRSQARRILLKPDLDADDE